MHHPAVSVGATLDDTVDFDGLSESDSRRLLQADRSKIINRTATEMADAIEMFIKSAEVIYFVDKYFGPESRSPVR